jgi:catechol 2,3-dioxygenase
MMVNIEELTGPPARVAQVRQPSGAGLGIRRGNYIAFTTPEPASAAAFACEHMGLRLAHVDERENHFLAAHGPDPYSLVYLKGSEVGADHVSFVVDGAVGLAGAERALSGLGVAYETVQDTGLWRHGPAIRLKAPNGTQLELTTGVDFDIPVVEAVAGDPSQAIAPVVFDHVILREADPEKAIAFAVETLGLRESGQIQAPTGAPILAFFRGSQLFHCYGFAGSQKGGVHHYQFSLKNDRAVLAAYEAMAADDAVEILWGPLRHACGQNIAFYFRDSLGFIVEFSAEEEVILDDAHYEVLHWPVQNMRASDEWARTEPPDTLKG